VKPLVFLTVLVSLATHSVAETNLERGKYEGVTLIPSKIEKTVAECLEPTPTCSSKQTCIHQYSSFSEIKLYKKEMLQEIVQRMTDQVYGKGFRHLGEKKDFDHCHLLLGEKQKPFAALCHTQEHAALYPDTDYDYVDREGRNWIVWLNGTNRIENAKSFRFDKKPKKWPPGSAEFDEYTKHYTVTPFMIDPKKMVHEQTAEDVEFFFTKTECLQVPKNVVEQSNVIRIKQKDGSSMCLFIEDNPCHDGSSTCKAKCLAEEITH
jgi:hypothetical protein